MSEAILEETIQEKEEKEAVVEGVSIYYIENGQGFPTVLLHGWPTSSFLWRNVYPALAEQGKVIVPDLPGYGQSEKSIGICYSINEQAERLGKFIEYLGFEKINLVVHDIGGTIGLLWAVRNADKINRLVISDTIIFPELKGILLSMRLLILFSRLPVIGNMFVTDFAIKNFMKLGVYGKSVLSREVLKNYIAPLGNKNGRRACLKSLSDINMKECKEIINKISLLKIPVKIVFGGKDFLMRKEMYRIKELLPEAEFTIIKNAGHFLQEDEPGKLGKELKEFLFN